MTTQNPNDQALTPAQLLELLHYAMVGIAFTVKDLQTSIAAQQAFGSNAVLDVFNFNPLKTPSKSYQQEYEKLIAFSKQVMKLLEEANTLRTKNNIAEFVKSKMGGN